MVNDENLKINQEMEIFSQESPNKPTWRENTLQENF